MGNAIELCCVLEEALHVATFSVSPVEKKMGYLRFILSLGEKRQHTLTHSTSRNTNHMGAWEKGIRDLNKIA